MSEAKWTEAHAEFLRLRVEENEYSTADIARLINEHFGTTYSRSSVIGKISRMGLSKKAPIRVEPRPRRSPTVSRTRITVPRTGVVPVTTTVNDESKHIVLSELEDGMCKWMTGDATYCGVVTGGKRVTYCACHQKAGVDSTRYRGRLWSVR